uniref:Uncharacterized protein n=1 Tax=Phaseolus vulgaris TaxID=3885 RepID=V7CNQ9_PHAVU|nr:hypothetical protein PHAVU_002G271900g [Phaseolus vulgaris]ESW31832.1 hypothetical protein PHAVU_002G271900g [Phaseolus vulgaris]
MNPAKEIQGVTCMQHRGPQIGPNKSYVSINNDSQHRMRQATWPKPKAVTVHRFFPSQLLSSNTYTAINASLPLSVPHLYKTPTSMFFVVSMVTTTPPLRNTEKLFLFYVRLCILLSGKEKKMEAPMLPLGRTSSIEREPRTLNIHQIQSARELAVYILNTKTIEEASRIFTEGLQPVVSGACCLGSDTRMDIDLDEELELMNSKDATTQVVSEAAAFRDIASAPF